MIRLNIVVEGQTEKAFANRVIVPHLSQRGVFPVIQLIASPKNSNARRFKGGWTSYERLKSHILRWRNRDKGEGVWFTTMLDLYAIPNDFPGFSAAQNIVDNRLRVDYLEKAMANDLSLAGLLKFIPYLQLHEFEALIFSSPRHLDWEFLEHEKAIRRLEELASEFVSPEDINNGLQTAPSKRIIKEIPEYAHRKASVGPLVADKIGLQKLREDCVHFGDWVRKLESLAKQNTTYL